MARVYVSAISWCRVMKSRILWAVTEAAFVGCHHTPEGALAAAWKARRNHDCTAKASFPQIWRM